jgi:hypothetical protein
MKLNAPSLVGDLEPAIDPCKVLLMHFTEVQAMGNT